MLQQDNKLDQSGLDELRTRLSALMKHLYKSAISSDIECAASSTTAHVIEEPMLVGLASLNEVYGPSWRDRLEPNGSTKLDIAAREAINRCGLTAAQNWPPTDVDLGTFDRLLKGIRLAEEA
jgi:hypothetical protein